MTEPDTTEPEPTTTDCQHPEDTLKPYVAQYHPDGTQLTPNTVYCGACGRCVATDSEDGTDTMPGLPGTPVSP